MEDDLNNFFKLNLLTMEDDLNFLKMDNDLIFFKWKTTSFWKMEDDQKQNAFLTNSTGNLTSATTKNILAQLKKIILNWL